MAGIHGKNAELRISTDEFIVTDEVLGLHSDPTLASRGVYESANENWQYIPRGFDGAALVSYQSPSGTVKQIDSNSRNIHYAKGCVLIPAADLAGLLAGSVEADYTHLTMDTVGNITSEDREFELNTEAETIDTTVIGEEFHSFVEGIMEWNGSLDGLYINPERFKLAVPGQAGSIPKKILRVRPNQAKLDTYFQGTVIFPTWNISGGFDSAIERGVEYQGTGPLELVEDGLPYFPTH